VHYSHQYQNSTLVSSPYSENSPNRRRREITPPSSPVISPAQPISAQPSELANEFTDQILLSPGHIHEQNDGDATIIIDREHFNSAFSTISFGEVEVEGEVCCICFGEFCEGREIRESHCHHFAHLDCYLEYVIGNGKQECPECAKKFSEKDS
jgi:hypothetical protein